MIGAWILLHLDYLLNEKQISAMRSCTIRFSIAWSLLVVVNEAQKMIDGLKRWKEALVQ